MENVTLAEIIIKSYGYTSSLYHTPSIYMIVELNYVGRICKLCMRNQVLMNPRIFFLKKKVAFLLTLHALSKLFLTLVLMDAARRVMKESLNGGPRKRCCVCYEMQVDSLLYRYVLILEAKLALLYEFV